MAIKESHLLEPLTGGVLSHGAYIDDAKSRAVVGLVRQAINNVLVVVDRLDWRLVQALVSRLGEGADVEDVRRGVAVCGLAGLVLLIELVVEEEVRHVLRVDDPALVRVGGARVRGGGDLLGGGLVGHIDDGEGVFVVVEADLLAIVLGVWALVNDALSWKS